MEKNFDPYRKWLGIAEDEQPPNHYRLLGLKDFESDVAAIRKAGEDRVQYLQDVSTGKHVVEAQSLLNQVAAAVVCLTNPEKKSVYDQQLKKGPVSKPGDIGSAAKQGPISNGPGEATRSATTKAAKKPSHGRGHSKSSMWFALAPVLLLVVAGGWLIWKTGFNKKSSKNTANLSKATDQVAGSWEPGKLVSADFAEGSVDRSWSSPLGEWEVGDGVRFNTSRDGGMRYLHLTGGTGRVVTLRLSDEVDRRGILTLRAERWSDEGEFDFDVQHSSDGQDWTSIPRETYGDEIKKRPARGDGISWSVIYQLDSPEAQYLRFVCDSAVLDNPENGGVLIESVKVAPRVN